VAGTGSAAVETDIDFLGALALGPAGTLTTSPEDNGGDPNEMLRPKLGLLFRCRPIGGPGAPSSDSASRRNMNL
jgi:hypothetical protein